MHITRCETLAELNELASADVVLQLQEKPDALICVATGNSPTGVYQKLAEKKDNFRTDAIRIIKLDEWFGLGINDAASCDHYIHKNILQPLNIGADNYIAFNGKAENAEAECERINNLLEEHGPIDICILGIGKNGHLGFNEPADHLQPHAHVATLSQTSLQHTMLKTGDGNENIRLGVTLGMTDILQSKKIILVVNGTAKKEIMDEFMTKQISTQLPASLLWLHGNTQCFYCDNDN